MYNIDKNGWNFFLSASNKRHYCILMIEQRTASGVFLASEQLKENLDACDRLLNASYVIHHLEIICDRIVCYLNYDLHHFNIRTFASSLEQLYFTLGHHSSCVFYSEAFLDPAQLYSEFNFLLDHSYFNILLGKRQPLSCRLLRSLLEGTNRPDMNEFYGALEELNHHRYKQMVQYLQTQSQYFKSMRENEHNYSFSGLFDYVSEIYYNLRSFLYHKSLSCDGFELPLWDMLFQYDGIAGILFRFSSSIEDLASPFLEINSLDKARKQHNEILEYTIRHIHTVSLSGLSAYFHLSTSYLCRIFKQSQGINFTEFVKKKRLELAIEALQTNNSITISELSKQLGYKSQSYFQNAFKQAFGVSPDAYRTQYHKKHFIDDSLPVQSAPPSV